MSTKSTGSRRDSKYVSTQPREIEYVASVFTNKNGETMPIQALYFIHYLMSNNTGKKVLREDLYSILETAGYKKGTSK